MRFNKVVFLLVVISTFLFSCTKEKSYEIPNPNSGIYLPHTTNATWHYEDTANQVGFTLKATDRIDSIHKIRFYYYENIPDDSSLTTTYTLIGRAGYNYYVSGLLPQLGDQKLLILKQDAVVGEIWHQKITVEGLDSVDLVLKIKEKGISHTVLGNNFNQVIHIGLSAKIPIPIGANSGSSILLPIGGLYFAKGIGIIQLELNFQEQVPSVHLLLTDYNIP